MLGLFSSMKTSSRVLEELTIVLVGDSTMRGAEENPSAYRTETLLPKGLAGVSITNLAFGGKKLRDVVAGNSPYSAWPTGIAGDIVLVGFGANEAAHTDSLVQWEADLNTVADDERVILRTPLPMDTAVFDPGVGNRETLAYAEVVRDVGASTGRTVIDAYAWTKSIPGWESLLRDKLHPTDDFYARLAAELYIPALAARAAELRA